MGIRVLRKAIECAGIFASARTLPEMGEGGGGEEGVRLHATFPGVNE